MEGDIEVFHVISGLHPRSGGTSRVVVDIADALANRSNMLITLLTQSQVNGDTLSSVCTSVTRVVAESPSRFSLNFGLPIRRELKRIIKSGRPTLIHSHGLWNPVNHWAALFARQNRIPLIMQSHGMLEPWALNHKALKKRVAMALFQRHDLETAKLLVATSTVEYENLRKLGLKMPIAVIPNGVAMNLPSKDDVSETFLLERERTVLFLSRVHPVKGVLNLVHAWAKIMPQGWKLSIVGPDEENHLQDVKDAVQQLGISESVEYLGEVEGEQKTSIYQDADLFVLPTFTENFGVVIAEALAHGLPVITTMGAPWEDLETYRCGWWIEIGVASLVDALNKAMALNDKDRYEMGVRGREYVRRYDWAGIAQQTEEVYQWVLGEGEKPDCVRSD